MFICGSAQPPNDKGQWARPTTLGVLGCISFLFLTGFEQLNHLGYARVTRFRPFGALDPLTRTSLQREFAGLAHRLGKTAIFVTHDVREALLLASRIGLMHSGQLLLLERPERFLASGDPHARAYIDSLQAMTQLRKQSGDDE